MATPYNRLQGSLSGPEKQIKRNDYASLKMRNLFRVISIKCFYVERVIWRCAEIGDSERT